MSEAQQATPDASTTRIETLSDGVFAIALTLLIIDVIAKATATEPGQDFTEHLLGEWPSLVAYLVGFMTIFVCWINHHCVFDHVRRSDSLLPWVNGVQLLFVSAVPLPTALLAEHITGEGSRTALIAYGITFWLIASSFWGLWHYVDRRELGEPGPRPDHYRALGTNYGLSVVWTIACIAVALVSVYPALAMWAIMFAVFAFPEQFAAVTASRLRRPS